MANRLRRFTNFFRRNFAFANSFIARMGGPQYSNWTIQKAVKEGYKANGWVYKAVNLTATSGSSVPWGVVDEDENRIEDSHVDQLFQQPNPYISRQDFFELWISWLELGGNALALKVEAQGETQELWPISPDRIHPISSKEVAKWLDGYSLDNKKSKEWEPNEIVHAKYFDPANPFWGIAPLQAAAKVVDIDTDQKDWNKAAMQNMGVLSGVFSFKRDFNSQDEADEVAESLNDRYAKPENARRLGVVGSEAKYTRIGSTPQELDFGASRLSNRDEIFIIFGIPPQYAGAMESATYNNYQTSELIFWFQKVIPLLDNLKDTFNLSFRDELEKGQTITYFLNDIPAIRRAMLERSKTAKNLYSMGVPFDRLNKVFKFDIEEFEGWDISYPGGKVAGQAMLVEERGNPTQTETRADTQPETPSDNNLLAFAARNVEAEFKAREDFAVKWSPAIEDLLAEQRDLINAAIDEASDQFDRVHEIRPSDVLQETWKRDWEPVYTDLMSTYMRTAADQILIEKRAEEDDELQLALDNYLEAEGTVLRELSMIEKSTVDAVLLQVTSAIEEGLNVNQLQQAIQDAGVFEPERALRLSRTITGTAGSMGQFVSAGHAGATHKKWVDSGFEVRPEHQTRAGEASVKLNARFSPQFGQINGPRYPLDPMLVPADRVNCRCSMTFEIRE